MSEVRVYELNGEKILISTFVGRNRNTELLDYHARVFQAFGATNNYIYLPFELGYPYGHGITQYVQSLINQVDYFLFFDIDAIPLKNDSIPLIIEKIKDKKTIWGIAQQSNHILKNGTYFHPYAGFSAIGLSKELYLKIGAPGFEENSRGDIAEELTWRCKELGYNVCLSYPKSFYELTTDEMEMTGNPKNWYVDNGIKYGLGTIFGDNLVYHSYMQNLKRSSDIFIKKCNEILGQESAPKEDFIVNAVVISVNCADYLELTLPENIKHFKNYYVGTVESDTETIGICKKYGAIPVICKDPHNLNGYKFDKGSCVQECLKQIKNRDEWVVLLDADIILPPEFGKLYVYNLYKHVLYGVSRSFAWDYNEYLEYKNGKQINQFENIPGGYGCGYFMFFNLNAPQIKNVSLENIYPNGNIQTDMILLEKFHPERSTVGKLEFKVLHLGGHSLFENGRIDNLGRFDCVKGKKFKDIPNVKELLRNE